MGHQDDRSLDLVGSGSDGLGQTGHSGIRGDGSKQLQDFHGLTVMSQTFDYIVPETSTSWWTRYEQKGVHAGPVAQ